MPRYPHLRVEAQVDSARYTAHRGRGRELELPDRDRPRHAEKLLRAIRTAQEQREPFPVQVGNGFYESPGLTLSFESDPNFQLAFESLDLQRSKIQLLSIITDEENRMIATVRVPDDKVQQFLKKIEAYRNPRPGKQDNKKLIESISNIKLATLRELWTDAPGLYPVASIEAVWEVWLRRPEKGESEPIAILRESAEDFGFQVVSNDLVFVDRTVVLVRGTREQLSRGAEVLGLIAEARKAKVTGDFYSSLKVAEQLAVSDDLIARLSPPAANSPVVGLLDTGVNHAHPLLTSVIAANDCQTFKRDWGSHDGHRTGHGTQMAGLCVYGDLTEVLDGDGPIELTHGVQSLKLINAADQHREDLYGVVTIEGISRLEIEVERRKVYCMAITADARDLGRPSSWSAAIDNLAFGTINDTQRFILISAGNAFPSSQNDYVGLNEQESVQDPAQAWNALTVGGCTNRAFINTEVSPGWTPVAPAGDLAPSSTTSVRWSQALKTPYKPDIVMEAGNMGNPPDNSGTDFLPELQLLTTNFQFEGGIAPFVDMHDTSAAVALAANLATRCVARYPDYWPETVRGFMVHSARWTDAMKARAGGDNERLLRMFGHGMPDPEALFYSAQNNLTLVAEQTLQPFFEEEGAIKSRDINYHALPWPKEALQALPLDTPIEMRVTLSYFIEPSPGERGWDRKYGYPSHGLRFKVVRPTEDLAQFKARINAAEPDDGDEDIANETGYWELGTGRPTNGSIHSNTWHGTAAELASRGHIAVHPTIGWWRTRKNQNRYDKRVRYSLIVSIHTPNADVDIYTPVAIELGIGVPVEITV